MTFRAIIFGLVLGMLLAALAYLNDWGLHLTLLANNLIMPGIMGLMLLGLLALNPLLHLLRLCPLQRGEWATIVSLMMVASVISGPALMWQFSEIVLLPQKYNHDSAEWRSKALLDYAPPGMLVSPGSGYEEAVEGFIRGRAADEYGSLVDIVPWQAWKGTLLFWIPLVALVFLGVMCLAVVVHPQWANNERLTYPVATLTAELLEGHSSGGVFRQKLFWLGVGISLTILMINALNVWMDNRLITIPLEFDFTSVRERFPALNTVPRMGWLLTPRIFFVGLALAFLVSNDVGFSVGISHLLFSAVVLMTSDFGLPWGWAVLESPFWSSMVMGSYVGMAVMLLYAGRYYYWNVLRRAIGFSSRSDVTAATAWACRAGLLCAAGGVFMLNTLAALPLPAAILFILSLGLLFLVMTRIHVETGVFVIQPAWWPLGVAIGIFGLAALGPKAVLVLAILSAVFVIDPRVAMMPVVSNVLRLGQLEGLRPARLAGWIAPTIVLALLVGVPAVLITQYYFGQGGHFWWASTVSQYSFNLLVRELGNFGVKATPELGFRAELIAPSAEFVLWALVGLVLVVGTATLRLRLTWWPIHPVLFLIWCSDTMRPLAASFLLGWMIKQAVMRFGGGSAFNRFRNLFIGLAAGEFLAAIIWAIMGASYYMATGKNVPEFKISPF